MTIAERFWPKVQKGEGCWLWRGAKDVRGYGKLAVAGRHTKAHRISYALAHGPIPEGLNVLHHCDTPACVNPEHLYAGTQADNMRDMLDRGRHVARPRGEACGRGHEFTEANTYLYRGKERRCRVCLNARQRAYTARRRRRLTQRG